VVLKGENENGNLKKPAYRKEVNVIVPLGSSFFSNGSIDEL